MKVKDIGTISTKYVNRASNAAADYNAGVQASSGQSAAAVAAIPLWQQAVSSPAAAARMTAGLQKAGDQGWKDGVSKKGQANYPNGIRAGANKYTANVGPYIQVLQGLTLDPKGLRGSAQNQGRSVQVQVALHTARLQRSGVGG
jgi:hypothetical protein